MKQRITGGPFAGRRFSHLLFSKEADTIYRNSRTEMSASPMNRHEIDMTEGRLLPKLPTATSPVPLMPPAENAAGAA